MLGPNVYIYIYLVIVVAVVVSGLFVCEPIIENGIVMRCMFVRFVRLNQSGIDYPFVDDEEQTEDCVDMFWYFVCCASSNQMTKESCHILAVPIELQRRAFFFLFLGESDHEFCEISTKQIIFK